MKIVFSVNLSLNQDEIVISNAEWNAKSCYSLRTKEMCQLYTILIGTYSFNLLHFVGFHLATILCLVLAAAEWIIIHISPLLDFLLIQVSTVL